MTQEETVWIKIELQNQVSTPDHLTKPIIEMIRIIQLKEIQGIIVRLLEKEIGQL